MAVGRRPSLSPDPSDLTRRSSSLLTSLAGASLAGVALVEVIHEGGFWQADALIVTVVSLAVVALQLVAGRRDRWTWLVTGAALVFAVCWLLRALTSAGIAAFLPFGASVLGFAASLSTVSSFDERQREDASFFVGCLGALVALTGFMGLIWRWYPLAMMSQRTWRLASTITYSDCAGLVMAMCLVVALGMGRRVPASRVCVFLCMAGVLATQSRGAIIALVLGGAAVPWRRLLGYLTPLLAGIAVGALAVATSPSMRLQPWLGLALVAGTLLSALWSPSGLVPRVDRRMLLVVAAILVVGIVATVIVRNEIALRALAPSDQDRAVEWRAAFDQFRSSPWVGVGPDKLLTFLASDGTYAHYAHNEYLQVLADTGTVGALSLVALVVSLVSAVRRNSLLHSCAIGGLVCLAAGGAFDFDWHVPVVGLLGGWIAGLAVRRAA